MPEPITIESFSFKATRGGNNPGTEYAEAKTNIGVIRFFDAADVTFAKNNQPGYYQADVKVNGNYKNGQNLRKTAAPTQEQAQQMSSTPQSVPVTRQSGSEFRSPDQFAREAAVRGAVDMVAAVLPRVDFSQESLKGVEPKDYALAIYSDWFEVLYQDLTAKPKSAQSEGLQRAYEGQQAASGDGPARLSGGNGNAAPTEAQAIHNEFMEIAQKAWASSGEAWKADADAWLVKQGFDAWSKLNVERRKEALEHTKKAVYS